MEPQLTMAEIDSIEHRDSGSTVVTKDGTRIRVDRSWLPVDNAYEIPQERCVAPVLDGPGTQPEISVDTSHPCPISAWENEGGTHDDADE